MAVVMHPIDASAGAPAYSGQQTRQVLGALTGYATTGRPLGARSGVRPGTPAATVFMSGAGSTTWNVASHNGILDTETPVAAGAYQYATDGADTGTITAANASNPRIDVIWVTVNDTVQDGSGNRNGLIGYSQGVAGATPAAPTVGQGTPAVPARAMILANINVPTAGTTSPTVSWVAPYTAAAGGIIPTPSSAGYPATPYTGLYVDDAATGLLMRYQAGTGWEAVAPVMQQVGIQPVANTDSSQAAGTTTWATLGTVTVPTWSTQAMVSLTIGGILSPTTQGNSKVAVQIGSVNGIAARLLEPGNTPGTNARFTHTIQDLVTGLGSVSGSQSVRIVTTFTAAGVYRLDINSTITAILSFLP